MAPTRVDVRVAWTPRSERAYGGVPLDQGGAPAIVKCSIPNSAETGVSPTPAFRLRVVKSLRP